MLPCSESQSFVKALHIQIRRSMVAPSRDTLFSKNGNVLWKASSFYLVKNWRSLRDSRLASTGTSMWSVKDLVSSARRSAVVFPGEPA